MSKEQEPLQLTPAAILAAASGDLVNAIRAMTPGGIEAQEADGQEAFVQSATLPRECLYCTQADFERMGIVFGDDVDELFIAATLPPGWTKVPTAHALWSELRDAQGRVRAHLFYKAAFYDRKAHMDAEYFFTLRRIYLDAAGVQTESYPPASIQVVIVDGNGAQRYTTSPIPYEQYEQIREAEIRCKGWLSAHYPAWQEYAAYWDEDIGQTTDSQEVSHVES